MTKTVKIYTRFFQDKFENLTTLKNQFLFDHLDVLDINLIHAEKTLMIKSKLETYMKELSEDIRTCFSQNGVFKNIDMCFKQNLFGFSRKIFSNSEGEMWNPHLFSLIKNVNWFVQQKFFVHDFKLSSVESVESLGKEITRCFLNNKSKEKVKIVSPFKSVVFNLDWLHKTCFETVYNFGSDISQLQAKLTDEINDEFGGNGMKFECKINPNVPLVDANEILDEFDFLVRDLQMKIYAIESD